MQAKQCSLSRRQRGRIDRQYIICRLCADKLVSMRAVIYECNWLRTQTWHDTHIHTNTSPPLCKTLCSNCDKTCSSLPAQSTRYRNGQLSIYVTLCGHCVVRVICVWECRVTGYTSSANDVGVGVWVCWLLMRTVCWTHYRRAWKIPRYCNLIANLCVCVCIW